MKKRHQGIYRIILTAVYRPIEEIDKDEKVGLLGENVIRGIERSFFKAEWKNLRTTIMSGYVVPVLRGIIKKSEQRRKNRLTNRH